MKLAFNTWPYCSFPVWLPSYPLEEAIRRIAGIGYTGVEVGCAAPHAWPAYLDQPRRQFLLDTARRHNVVFSSLVPALGGGPGLNPASPDPAERAACAQYHRDLVDLAVDWGRPLLVWVGGWIMYGVERARAWELARETLRPIAAYANDRGVRIAVEPTSADSDLVETLDGALQLVAEIGLPNLGVMFDTYHALYRHERPADYVRQAGGRLIHVHLADVDRLPPGRGRLDLRPMLQALRETGYDGYLAMEIGFSSRGVDPDVWALQAYEYVKSIGG